MLCPTSPPSASDRPVLRGSASAAAAAAAATDVGVRSSTARRPGSVTSERGDDPRMGDRRTHARILRPIAEIVMACRRAISIDVAEPCRRPPRLRVDGAAGRREGMSMARDDERLERSPGGRHRRRPARRPRDRRRDAPDAGLGVHLRGLADELLVNDFPGATISRAEREMLATAVSAANDCFYCMDSHGAFATALLESDGATELAARRRRSSSARPTGSTTRCRRSSTSRGPSGATRCELTADRRRRGHAAGATDADVQLAVLIAAAFSMYNRMVDGFRARTPPTPEALSRRAPPRSPSTATARLQARAAAGPGARRPEALTLHRVVGRSPCHQPGRMRLRCRWRRTMRGGTAAQCDARSSVSRLPSLPRDT